ncbi:MAG: 50S ribosomal L9 C-terminal domain-containing protein, partial [Dehalococcoidales bacterium]|nr:50S ribosomal L9 C-terminal domain-containing protein [Dehalococcoidales bacterium]
KLYGSVTDADIADELGKAGLNIDKKKIELAEPIHHLGNYEISIRLIKDIVPKIKLTVAEAEEQKEGE